MDEHNAPEGQIALDTCSIIGSFRKYYSEVAQLIKTFDACKIRVLSPKASSLVDPNELFVRLKSDGPLDSPEVIQLIALHRILRSKFVYVLCPDGYVGNTTCYEIGRIHERHIPLYFSSPPRDLPITVAPSSIMEPDLLVQHIRERQCLPVVKVDEIPEQIRTLDTRLRDGNFID